MSTQLVGCSTPPTSSISSTIAPPPSSPSIDHQAESVWDAYIATANRVFSSGSESASLFRPYVSQRHFKDIKTQVEGFRDDGLLVMGAVGSRNFTILSTTSAKVVALVCVDNTHSRLAKVDGKSVKDDREKTFNLRLVFTRTNGRFVIDEDKLWTQSSVC